MSKNSALYNNPRALVECILNTTTKQSESNEEKTVWRSKRFNSKSMHTPGVRLPCRNVGRNVQQGRILVEEG